MSKETGREKEKKPVAVPRPSSSVILISPENQVLLLHRVQTSTSFASAHVFPGGNLSSYHEDAPSTSPPHTDNPSYRLAAIRETFEESGIILAKSKNGNLLDVNEDERDKARKDIHSNSVKFGDWLHTKEATADTEGLIPFTRWITPTNLPKRFTTQMYLYFLPLTSSVPISSSASSTSSNSDPETTSTTIPIPTPDGGIEHTTAKFLPPSTWLRLCSTAKITLFPPQFFLLHLISPFLSPHCPAKQTPVPETQVLRQQREELIRFVSEGDWGDKCISPTVLAAPGGKKREDGRVVLGLDRAGPECRGGRGDAERVVLVEFGKGGPRRLEVGWRSDVLAEGREKGKL